MATIQNVFDVAEALNREMQLQSGEADVTRGIVLYNMAKRYFESRIATKKNILGSGTGTVTTSASTESTAFPTGVLRIDRLQFIDPSTSLPGWDLKDIHQTGGHAQKSWYNLLGGSTSSTGRPRGYWTDGTNIYWTPLPSGTHTVRWYGFEDAADGAAAGDTFPYPDICINAFGAYMAETFRLGLDDPQGQEAMVASEKIFAPVLEALSNFRREGARIPTYRSTHRV